MSYTEDFAATVEGNFIREEFATINYDASRDFYYILPKKAPFHTKDFKIWRITSAGRQEYHEHHNYHFGARFVSLSHAINKPVFGAVVIPKLDADAQFVFEYRTVGDPHVKQETELLAAVANVVINPVGLTWEVITGTPSYGRAIGHVIDYEDTQGQSHIIETLQQMVQAILSRADTGGNYVDVRDLSKALFGLENVPNFGIGSIGDLGAGNNQVLMTPTLTHALLEEMGLLELSETLAAMRAHLTADVIPHPISKGDVGLSLTPNLALADDEDIIRGTPEEKLFTTRQMLMWLRLHGPSLGIGNIKHKPGTKLTSYCRTGSFHRWAIISTGEGTREEIEVENDITCGAYQNIPVTYPAKSEVFKRYCDKGNLMKLVSNGDGTAYADVDELNSSKCITNELAPAGQELSFKCEGTTLTRYLADGQGNVITEVTENSERCNATFPPAGQFIRDSCEGFTQIVYEADGVGGERIRYRNENHPSCGYVPPTQPVHPSAGTVLGYRCDDGKYMDLIADGVGGNFPQRNAAKDALCVVETPPVTSSTTTSRQVERNPSISWTTTHTSIYINDTETQKITGRGFAPNELITLSIMGESNAWGQPYLRNLEDRQIRANASGEFSLYINVTEIGIVAVGTYRSWFEAAGVRSNVITRTFYGSRF